jgi:hypothetical protein
MTMMSKETISRLVAYVTAASLLCGCKLPPASPAETQVLVVVLDSSRSGRAIDRCAELEARLSGTLSQQAAESIDVLVLGAGDVLEPTAIVSWRHHSPTERLYGDPEGEARERAAFVAELTARCRSTIRSSRRSPIFQATRRGAEAIRARCAELERDGQRCAAGPTLALDSDLRETEEPSLARALRKERGGAPTSTLPKIDLRGIDVRVCGHAEYAGRKDSGDVVAAWRAVLGEGASFDPVCAVQQHADHPGAENQ